MIHTNKAGAVWVLVCVWGGGGKGRGMKRGFAKQLIGFFPQHPFNKLIQEHKCKILFIM